MHDIQPDRGAHHPPPRSVDDLDRDPAWEVTRSAAGHWTTAETSLQVNGTHWRIGLTPVTHKVAALIMWANDEVVAHTRGNETALCATALHWLTDITSR